MSVFLYLDRAVKAVSEYRKEEKNEKKQKKNKAHTQYMHSKGASSYKVSMHAS